MININFSVHWLQIAYGLIGSFALGYIVAVIVCAIRFLWFKKPYDLPYKNTEEEFSIGFVMTTWVFFLPAIAYLAVGAALSALDEKCHGFFTGSVRLPAVLIVATLRGIYNFRNSKLWKKITMSRKMKDIRSEAIKAMKEQQEKNPVFLQNPVESGVFKDFKNKQEEIKKEAFKALKKQKQKQGK